MATIRQGFMISEIMDKMDIKIANPEGTAEQIGSELVLQLIKNAYKARVEILRLVASVNGITPEEAVEVDLAEFIKRLLNDVGLSDFFGQAVK